MTKFDALEGDEEDKDIIEKEDISAVYKRKMPTNSSSLIEKVKDKQILFPQVRNIDQENDPIYETEKCVYVNPNSFERVEKVFEEVQKRTNTYGNDTSFLTISEDGRVCIETRELPISANIFL